MKKRKICIVVASRANYGRIKTAMTAIKNHPKLELQLIVGASALLSRFGGAVNVIEKDGFNIDHRIHYVVEGENLETQAKTTGLGIIELTSAFQQLRPDFVLTVADRYETMATAIAATYMNIPLIHVQGGEISGNIDDRVRHAITKMADVHFACTQKSYERIIKMGEHKDVVFNVGCPSIDVALSTDKKISNSLMKNYLGTGDDIDWEKPYLLLLQHPVTSDYKNGFAQIEASLNAMKSFKEFQKIVIWPNSDAGSDDVAKGIRVFKEKNQNKNLKFHYFRNFSPEDYIKVMSNAACCIGNSSSFIRDGAALGCPAVIVGDRQQSRERGENVIDISYETNEIINAISKQIAHGKYSLSPVYGNGTAGTQIAEIMSKITLPKSKCITY